MEDWKGGGGVGGDGQVAGVERGQTVDYIYGLGGFMEGCGARWRGLVGLFYARDVLFYRG